MTKITPVTHIVRIAKSDKKAKILKPFDRISLYKDPNIKDIVTLEIRGEVNSPGTKQVRSSSPLSEAIFSAGGLTKDAKKTNLALYRLNDNGTIELKRIEYSPTLEAGTENNPTLKDRDVLLIGKNAWAKFNSALDNMVDPISPLLNAASIYRLFE